MIVLFCASSVPLAHLASFMFNSVGGLTMSFSMFNILSYVLTSKTGSLNSMCVMKYLVRSLPIYAFITAFLEDHLTGLQNNSYPLKAWTWDRTGIACVALGVTFVLFCAALIFIDTFTALPGLSSIFRCCRRKGPDDQENDMEDDDVRGERERIVKGADDLIRVKKLRREYRPLLQQKKVAVKSISFGVKAGEIFGFLGVNGAGKSTTLKMLTGDVAPSSGSARLNGFSIKTQQRALRRFVGYCPQTDALIEKLSPREHLKLFARIRNVPEKNVATLTSALIDLIGLTEHADKKVKELSFGNKRKLSTVIALIGCPKICFLDEPSSGMDPQAKRAVWDLITKTMGAGAVILNTHHMEECEALCQRVSIMISGEFRCIGTLPHLKSKFGKGYHVEISTGDEEFDDENLTEFIEDSFPDSSLSEQHGTTYKYFVPKSGITLGQVFTTLESPPEDVSVVNYSVSEVGIEQIFIQVSKKEEAAKRRAGAEDVAPRAKHKKPKFYFRFWKILTLLAVLLLVGTYTAFQDPECYISDAPYASHPTATAFKPSKSKYTLECESGYGIRGVGAQASSVEETIQMTCLQTSPPLRAEWSEKGCVRKCSPPEGSTLTSDEFTLLNHAGKRAEFKCLDDNHRFSDSKVQLKTECQTSGKWSSDAKCVPWCDADAADLPESLKSMTPSGGVEGAVDQSWMKLECPAGHTFRFYGKDAEMMKSAQKSSDITTRTPEIQCLGGKWQKLENTLSKCYEDNDRFGKFFALGYFGQSTNGDIAADVRAKARAILKSMDPTVSAEISAEIIHVAVSDGKQAGVGNKSWKDIVVTSRCTFYQDICDGVTIDFNKDEFKELDGNSVTIESNLPSCPKQKVLDKIDKLFDHAAAVSALDSKKELAGGESVSLPCLKAGTEGTVKCVVHGESSKLEITSRCPKPDTCAPIPDANALDDIVNPYLSYLYDVNFILTNSESKFTRPQKT
eukprot:197117_1